MGARRLAADLGDVDLNTRDFSGARAYCEESLRVSEELGDISLGVMPMFNLGAAALGEGRLSEASSHFAEVIRLASNLGRPEPLIWALLGTAAVAASRDEPGAARLLGAVESQLAIVGCQLGPAERRIHQQTLTAARADLGEREFAVALDDGRELTAEHAVAHALEHAQYAGGAH